MTNFNKNIKLTESVVVGPEFESRRKRWKRPPFVIVEGAVGPVRGLPRTVDPLPHEGVGVGPVLQRPGLQPEGWPETNGGLCPSPEANLPVVWKLKNINIFYMFTHFIA